MGLDVPVVKTHPQMKDIAALNVLVTILDGGESARLSKHLIRDKQMASFIDVSYDPFTRMNSLIVFSAYPKQGVPVQQLTDAIWQEIVALQTQPITEAELNRAKVQYKAHEIYSQDSIADQAMEIGSLESVGLSWKTKNEFLSAVENVSADDVQQAAIRFFSRDGLTIGILESLPLDERTPS
jgi:zinc protease